MIEPTKEVGCGVARLLALLIALVLVAASCGSDNDAVQVEATPTPTATSAEPSPVESTPAPSPESTPSATATTDPAATPESDDYSEPAATPEVALPIAGWQQVGNGTHLWANEIISVAGEFFAIGAERGPEVPVPRSGVWVSSNGVSWTESLIFPRPSPTDPAVNLGDIAVIDDEIVAVGQRTEGPSWPHATKKELVALASDDGGQSWSETIIHQWDGQSFRDWPTLVTFAYGDPNVIYAVEGSSDVEQTAIMGTLMWIKTDDGWTYVDPAESGLAQVWVWAIAATDDGYVALADAREQVEGFEDCQTQGLWQSPDARTWTKVWENDTDCEWFSTNEVFTVDGDLLALGNESNVASCTIRADGSLDCPPVLAPVRLFRITGQAIEDIEVGPIEFTQMFLSDVANGNGILVAVGRTFDEREARIWVSADAQSWVPADVPAELLADIFLFQAATNEDAIIALATEIVPATGPTNFHTWLTTER